MSKPFFFFFCELQGSQNTWYILGSLNKVDISQYVKDLLNIWFLRFVPDQFKTQEICNRAVQSDPWVLRYVPDQFKTQEMCNRAMQRDPWMIEHVPDHFITQKMCNEAV